MNIIVNNLAKCFNGYEVFRNISFEISMPSSLAIVGNNGSGKTTLLKILAGALLPSEGSVVYYKEGNVIETERLYRYISYVAPYLELYGELTAEENLRYFTTMRMGTFDLNTMNKLLHQFGLQKRKNELVRHFSTGMKQRLKYVLALLQQAPIIFIDEPTANLDTEGCSIVEEVVSNYQKDRIVVLATNSQDEAKWCCLQLSLVISSQ